MMDGIHAAVIGYGRIATVLSDKLTALGAQVYLYARKERDLARAAQRHLFPMRLESVRGKKSALCYLPRDCRVIFNTVPYPLFTREVLETIPRNCLYIDLASAPGGIDWAAASDLSNPLTKYSAFLEKGWGLGKGKTSFHVKRSFPLPQELSPFSKNSIYISNATASRLKAAASRSYWWTALLNMGLFRILQTRRMALA